MSGRDIAEAAARIKKKKELLKLAVPMKPYAPENIKLSYAEFVAKRKKENEEEVAVADFRKKFRDGKKGANNGEQKEEEKGKEILDNGIPGEVKRRVGRPKKIVE